MRTVHIQRRWKVCIIQQLLVLLHNCLDYIIQNLQKSRNWVSESNSNRLHYFYVIAYVNNNKNNIFVHIICATILCIYFIILYATIILYNILFVYIYDILVRTRARTIIKFGLYLYLKIQPNSNMYDVRQVRALQMYRLNSLKCKWNGNWTYR